MLVDRRRICENKLNKIMMKYIFCIWMLCFVVCFKFFLFYYFEVYVVCCIVKEVYVFWDKFVIVFGYKLLFIFSGVGMVFKVLNL